MELAERLRNILSTQYGITSDDQLIEALKNQKPLDIGIFVSQCRKEESYAAQAG